MECKAQLWKFCIIESSGSIESSIFGFGEFITALALLVIVYTITDIRYRFRLSIAPGYLFRQSFIIIGVVGCLILGKDLWIAQKWWVLHVPGLGQAVIEAVLGALFLYIAITWIFHAFIRPPVFSRKNCKRYTHVLYPLILKGSETELPILADELARSAESIVELGSNRPPEEQSKKKGESNSKRKFTPAEHVDDLLWLIADKQFCRHIAASSPATAIVLLEKISKEKKYALPYGLFAHNVVEEALRNPNSRLYHERDLYSGLLGTIKPFSQTIFGDYQLVESSNPSPLDAGFATEDDWSAIQLSAYTHCVLITIKAYLNSHQWGAHSFSIYRSFSTIKSSIIDVTSISVDEPGVFNLDSVKRLRRVISFLNDAIDLIADRDPLPRPVKLRPSDRRHGTEDLYDLIAELIFDVIDMVAWVNGNLERIWWLHRSTVWGEFFRSFRKSKARSIVLFKVRRKIFDAIMEMEKFQHFQSARLLGFCLNIFGLEIGKSSDFGREDYALRRVLIPWAKKNYMNLHVSRPDIAKACLIGGITFDSEKTRLVKTYSKGLAREPGRKFLELEVPEPEDTAK